MLIKGAIMNQQEILQKAQKEYQEKALVKTETKQIVKRKRRAKSVPVVTVEKPQPQTFIKRVPPQDLSYLESELQKVFTNTAGTFDFDLDAAVVNFRGGRKVHECESLRQPAQALVQCAKSFINLSFGNRA